MAGYLDPKIKPDPSALDRPDDTSAYCVGQFLGAVAFLIVLLVGIFFIGWVRSG
jgi:hypothetical protein